MRKTYLYISLILVLIVFSTATRFAYATTEPTFPSCLSPQGDYQQPPVQGTHGIPGNETAYTGIDTVYKLNAYSYGQCLCPIDGNGIQTNWWKVNNLSDSDIESLKNEGWIYVPDGSAWGLDPSPYLAKNINYLCLGGQGGGDNGSSGGSSSSSSSSNDGGSSSSSAVNTILSLASTGNIIVVYFYFIAGIALLATGFILKVRDQNRLKK